MMEHQRAMGKVTKKQIAAATLFLVGVFLSLGLKAQSVTADEVLSDGSDTVGDATVDSTSGGGSSSGSGETGTAGQSKIPGEMDGIEEIYATEGTGPIINDGQKKTTSTSAKGDGEERELKGVSDLANLAPFKDVAILQKRFLPKTKRFEFYGGLNGILNDKFFVNIGVNGRLAFAFNERYAIEAIGMFIATGEKDVTKNLREARGVVTTNFVSPKSYYGVDFKWTPLYGKMSFLNQKITPFDLYFSGGLGLTNTNQGGSEPTVHLGTGQLFAFSKGSAFRWDFSWNFYNAKSTVAGAQQSSLYNNLFLTVGWSFFFPEATYR